MISTKRASKILLEQDKVERDKLIDKLTGKDAKEMLKHCLTVIRKEEYPGFSN